MKLASHLWRSRHGIYYLRLVSRSGEFKRSLNTRDPAAARLIAYQFNALRISMNPEDLIRRLNGGTMKSWKLKQSSDAIEIETDGTQQDHERALEALKLLVQAMPAPSQQPPATRMPSKLLEISLKQCADDYLAERVGEVSKNTISTYRACFNKLVKALGPETPIQAIDSQRFVDFRLTQDHLLAIKTVKRDVDLYKNFFAWAIERGRYTGANPVSAAKHSAAMRARLKAERGEPINPFNGDDLRKIFDSARYGSIKKPCAFWLPLLALFTGARLGELASLRLSDIGEGAIAINESKTEHGLRKIPIHPKLVELGLLDYVSDVRELGINDLLFPHLKAAAKNGLGNLPGRDFSAMKQSLELGADKVFHSFRKTLISCLQFNQCPSEIRRIYVGHAPSEDGRDVHISTYSKASFSPSELAERIFPCLDFEAWPGFDTGNLASYSKGRFNQFLQAMALKQQRAAARAKRKA